MPVSDVRTLSKLAAFALFLDACGSASPVNPAAAGAAGAGVASGGSVSTAGSAATPAAAGDAASERGGSSSAAGASVGGNLNTPNGGSPDLGGGGGAAGSGVVGGAGAVAGSGVSGTGGTTSAPFTLTSPDFTDGSAIPKDATCATSNPMPAMPALTWTGVPPGTKSFALTFLDTTRLPNPQGNHYAIYDIPSDVTSLPKALPAGSPPAGNANLASAKQKNPLGPQYLGPCPNNANGTADAYEFTIYALSQDKLPGTVTDVGSIVQAIVAANPLAHATLKGTSDAKGTLR